MYVRERFPHPYKECFVPFSNQCRISQSTPLRGLWAFPFGLPLKVFKTRLLGRGFRTLIKTVSFPSPIDVGSHNPPPFRAFGFPFRTSPQSFQNASVRERLPHPYKECFVPLSNQCTISQSTPLLGLWAFPFELPLKVFKTHLLGRDFHTLIKNVLLPSPTNVGSHNPPSFGAFGLSVSNFPSRFLKQVC